LAIAGNKTDQEDTMFKRPYFLGLLAIVLVSFLFLAKASGRQVIKPQDRADQAERLWSTSAHADKTGEPFTHWNEEGEIPTTCAKCHSTPGFRDYIGADGSTPDVVDKAAPTGTTVECTACHAAPENGVLNNRTYVIFPSGVKVADLGPESMCMTCHQGRASTDTVNAAITKAGVTSNDQVSSKLSFINVHYFASGATQFGTVARGGYQYAGKSYDARFAHIPGYNACQVCHNPHSLKVDLEACNTCHIGIKDPKDIRFYGSWEDYDGDGNYTEGMYYEIEAIREIEYNAVRAYAGEVVGKPIAYDTSTYPYFFNDKNDNGVVDSDEADSSNGYSSFTARLLRAAYNLQVAVKDPNSYAHGGKYIIELLYDSIQDLNSGLEGAAAAPGITRPNPLEPVQASSRVHGARRDRGYPLREDEPVAENSVEPSAASTAPLYAPYPSTGLIRTDEGHFDGSAEPWRHWDAQGEVPASCAKCHSPEGLPYLLENGKIDKGLEISNGLLCMTCHTSPPLTRYFASVPFPSGVAVDLGDASNLCLNCHQGRASKQTIDKSIASGPGPYNLTNIHYYAAAASFFGSEVHGGYEFSGKTYAGRNLFPNHNALFTDCIECHMGTKSFNRKHDDSDALFHNVQAPNPADCVYCHGQDVSQPHPGADPRQFEFSGIRPGQVPDLDADGNTHESLQDEIAGLEDVLYARLQAYGSGIGSPIVYSGESYPYFFNDLNGNGRPDPDEMTFPNQYKFTAPMLRAAYNFLLSKKEPCGYIHNYRYIAQLLLDSIEHLGGNVKKYTWR
jgi:hypothetical protein